MTNKRKAVLQKKQEILQYRKQRMSSSINSDSAVIDVPVIIKGDVSGSVEALLGILKAKQPNLVKLNVIHSSVGGVSDSDVEMAFTTGGKGTYTTLMCIIITYTSHS